MYPDLSGLGLGLGFIPSVEGEDPSPSDRHSGSLEDTGDDACCIAGTLILTDTGYTPIEKIKIGDSVCGWNYSKDSIEVAKYHTVIATMSSATPVDIISITTATGATLVCSLSHPVWCPDYGIFVQASKIDTGDNVLLYGSSSESIVQDQVVEINYLNDKQIVYNFTVEHSHTYTANNILCHNVGHGHGDDDYDGKDIIMPDGHGHPPGGGGGGGPGGYATEPSTIDVEYMYGPTVYWVDSPYSDSLSESTPWDDASDYPSGDYTAIQLRTADSSIRNGNLPSIDPLTEYGMMKGVPEIIAVIDHLPTELDISGTYTEDPTSTENRYINAGDVFFSNGPSKLLRMQIMSGIFLRANINSLFSVFRLERAPATSPYSNIDWLAVPPSLYTLISHWDAVRKSGGRIFAGYAAQTSRNMYVKLGLQMGKSMQSRALNLPADTAFADGMNYNQLRADPTTYTTSFGGTVGRGSLASVRGEEATGNQVLGKYRVSQHSYESYMSDAEGGADFSRVGSLAAGRAGNTLESLFSMLHLSNRYRTLCETGIFIQLLQELRKLILDGSHQMSQTADHSGAGYRSIDYSLFNKFTIVDDLATTVSTAFAAKVIQVDELIQTDAFSGRWGSEDGSDYGATSIQQARENATGTGGGGAAWVTIGGIIPRGEDGDIGRITVDDLNYRLYGSGLLSNADDDGLLDVIPQGYEEALPSDHLEQLVYMFHFLNREFIMSTRWKLSGGTDGGWNSNGAIEDARRFNETITWSTPIQEAIDQIIGDNTGDIRHNTRDPDSFGAALNPDLTSTTDFGSPGGYHSALEEPGDQDRILPFEITDGNNYISGYSAYINDLADSFIKRDTHSDSDVLKAYSLQTWAEGFGRKQEDLSSFVRNLLMIGHIGRPIALVTDQTAVVSNHLLMRTVCLNICKFINNANIVDRILENPGSISAADSEYPGRVGFVPKRYEQTIQLDIIKSCMHDPNGYTRLEAYLRYRRQALETYDSAGDSYPKWPDFGDFEDGPSDGGSAGIGSGYEFGGGLQSTGTYGRMATSSAAYEGVQGLIDDIEEGAETDFGDVTYLNIDDETFWWEDYYAAFAFAYPRFTQAASDLAYFYVKNRNDYKLEHGTVGSSSTLRCATVYMQYDTNGQSKTRYGLMQTPVGAALIEQRGVEGTAGKMKPIWDYIIETWDDYVDAVRQMAVDLEANAGSEGNQFSDASRFAQGSASDYTANVNTWNRNISLETMRMLTWWTMSQMIYHYVARRSLSSIHFDSGTNIDSFQVKATADAGGVWNSLLDSDDWEVVGDDGAYIANSGHEDSDSWRYSDNEGLNVSSNTPFSFFYRMRYDAVESQCFLVSCINAFGAEFASQISDTIWNDNNSGAAYGSAGVYSSYIADMGNYWDGKSDISSLLDDARGIYELNTTGATLSEWYSESSWDQPFEAIPAMATCLVNEDLMILRILNAFNHVNDILNNRMSLGQEPGGSDTTSSTYKSHKEFVEYLRRYAFGTLDTGEPGPTAGTIDLDEDEQSRKIVKSIFNSMTPDAVATAYSILCDNFTLSTAYINNLSALPTPMMNINDASFNDVDGTASYAHLMPASETVSEANYAAIRWFQNGAKNKVQGDVDPLLGDINKKILVVGLPTGMLQELREKAEIDEQVYRQDAFTTSNFTYSSLIRIRVIKKSNDNPGIAYTPRTFYYDARLFYGEGGQPINPFTLQTNTTAADTTYASATYHKRLASIGEDNYSLAKGMVGVYAYSPDDPEISGGDLPAVRDYLRGMSNGPYDSYLYKFLRTPVERRVSDHLEGAGDKGLYHIAVESGITSNLDNFHSSGIRLRKFELGAAQDVESERIAGLNLDFDVDNKLVNDWANNVWNNYSHAIQGTHTSVTAEQDPTLDFFGGGDSASMTIGESLYGIESDPWVYDQLSGEYYKEATSTSSGTGERFAAQAVMNEVYSGILKQYIKMMSGFNVTERCFLNQNNYGGVLSYSPPIFTEYQNVLLKNRRPPSCFGGTDYYTTSLGISGGVTSGYMSVIDTAKLVLMSRAKDYLGNAISDISSLELQSMQTMMYRTLPISSDKFRNQALLPKKFDRTFCILIDPEEDFQPYNTTAEDDILNTMIEGGGELIMETTYTSAKGLMFSFLVDVAIVPMNSSSAQERAGAEGENIT